MTTETVAPAGAPVAASAPGLRELMAGFPTGVAVVTAFDHGGRPWGMTCTSLCSVTLDPPTLLVCLRTASPTLDATIGRGAFAVHLLHEGARAVAELFASGAPDRFARLRWVPGPAGPRLLDAAHARAECAVAGREQVGDHTVLLGRVERVALVGPAPAPLLYGRRSYRAWSTTGSGTAD